MFLITENKKLKEHIKKQNGMAEYAMNFNYLLKRSLPVKTVSSQKCHIFCYITNFEAMSFQL